MHEGGEDPLVGRTIAGKFVIESLVGSGGMGAVYKSRQIALDKTVAVKVMHDAESRNKSYASRFQREARAASRLNHPNSIQIIDFGEEPDGLLYIAMEFLDGTDLAQVIEHEWPLPEARVVDILSQTLAALAVAHDMKVVHRDLKPENIMIVTKLDDESKPRDLVKVCDFGIAKFTETIPPPAGAPGRALTTKGIVVGTPEYMAPEQARGEAADARTDLYSIGVILYQLLAGRIPFRAASPIDLVLMHVASEPTPPTNVNPNASPALEAVCLKAMKKKRAERYESAREMRMELRAAWGRSTSGRIPVRTPTPKDVELVSSNAATMMALPSASSAPDAVAVSPPSQSRSPARTAATIVAIVLGVGATAVALREGGAADNVDGRRMTNASAMTMTSAPVAFASGAPSAVVTVPNDPAPTPIAPTVTTKALLLPFAPSAVAASAQPVASASASQSPTSSAVAPTTSVIASVAPPANDPPPIAATAPTPTASAPPPPFDPSAGRVAWTVSGAGGGATTTNVARAIAHAASAWTGCYQAGLRTRGARVEGAAMLRLTCDEEGRVIGATMNGLDMADVNACIRRTAIGVVVPNVDTGAAWATISISFQVPK